MNNPDKQPPSSIELYDVNKLTLVDLLRLVKRFTIGSWIVLIGLIITLTLSMFWIGWGYRDGSLPTVAYILHEEINSPIIEKIKREEMIEFENSYSEFVDWQTLQSIATGIEEYQPDGLETSIEIAASLLAQVRSTRGSASFLSGTEEISVVIKKIPDGFRFEWSHESSIVRRIANDAGYNLSDDELRLVNANLNRFQFAYLDDEMERAVIYRNLDGGFGLVIRDSL